MALCSKSGCGQMQKPIYNRIMEDGDGDLFRLLADRINKGYRIGHDGFWVEDRMYHDGCWIDSRTGNLTAPRGYINRSLETLSKYIPQEFRGFYDKLIAEEGVEIGLTPYQVYLDGRPIHGYRWFNKKEALVHADADPVTVRATLAHELFEDTRIPHSLVKEMTAEWLKSIGDTEAYVKTLELNKNW